MARNAGQPAFSLFEITPVGLVIASVGSVWLYFVGARQLGRSAQREEQEAKAPPILLGEARNQPDGSGDSSLGPVNLYSAADRTFTLRPALLSLFVFVAVITAAALGWAPIAAAAFAGAVALILLGVITPDDAYAGLRPEILLLIAGMVVIGTAMEITGLAAAAAAR
ncbi:MAG: hypothetical protein BGN86_12395 [Caulobacterales bacterium 68-7]|nr:MAG: hypothetical protein BGN86_12395 [Caulobacterales bacterium 68-7]